MNVHPELFVTRSRSMEREFRGTVACDTSRNRIVAGQERMNDFFRSFRKLKLKVLDVALS